VSEETDQFALALSVGMNAAAEVARIGGFLAAAAHIRQYEKDWSAKVRPHRPRAMVRGDIMPQNAARFSVASDFGLDQPPPPSLTQEASPEDADPDDTASDDLAYSAE